MVCALKVGGEGRVGATGRGGATAALAPAMAMMATARVLEKNILAEVGIAEKRKLAE